MKTSIVMNINYQIKGEGRAIVLLHGWGGSSASLEKLQDFLAGAGFKVINLDLPGFGESDIPTKPLKLEDYVEYLAQTLTALKLEKPVLLGHSFGGKISMLYAKTYPNKISSLILVNASGIKPNNELKKNTLYYPTKVFGSVFDLPLLKQIKPLIRKLYYKLVVGEHDYVKSGPMQETMKNIIARDLDDELKDIKTPTLVIWGEKDKDTPLWQGQKLATEINDARLEVVADATHGLPLHRPDIVANLTTSFLGH